MQRVLIIGNCGAGKSTFARQLAQRTGLPLIHLDQAYWKPGWEEPDPDTWDKTLQEVVARPRWIMDGNYSSSFPVRFPRADTVIWIQANRWTCLARVVFRNAKYFRKTRPDMAPGCPERFSWSFLHYVLMGFKARKARIERALEQFSGDFYRLRTENERLAFFQAVQPPTPGL